MNGNGERKVIENGSLLVLDAAAPTTGVYLCVCAEVLHFYS